MTRDYHPCAWCGALTSGRDSEGDPACVEGSGCTVVKLRRDPSRPSRPWSRSDVARLRDLVARGYTTTKVALILNRNEMQVRRKVVALRLRGVG